jgi:hypothetical protein
MGTAEVLGVICLGELQGLPKDLISSAGTDSP